MSEAEKAITGFTIFIVLFLLVFALALYYDWKKSQSWPPRWRDRSGYD